ncbi:MULTISPECIES: hypothetical protein [Oscillatoriales]|uniref:hypothetical protein n=1 Tax=Oscillatoriophycideae TaxID=1301283 RepID=UPI00168626AA|nr:MULTISPECIES: hypothetical protein [Oscillatoriales]
MNKNLPTKADGNPHTASNKDNYLAFDVFSPVKQAISRSVEIALQNKTLAGQV